MTRSAFLLFLVAFGLVAHEPVTTKLTWSEEISRIVYRRCAQCHREGGVAPMALRTYEEARPWAKAIKSEVLGRRMPPWGAVKGYGEFKNDASLTQDEILRIAEWVEGGAPEGEVSLLPPFPERALDKPKPVTVRQVVQLPKAGAVLLAIKPTASISLAKINAHLPDGAVIPLLWLKDYHGRWKQTFNLRKPIRLPANTIVRSDPPDAPMHLLLQSSRTGKVN